MKTILTTTRALTLLMALFLSLYSPTASAGHSHHQKEGVSGATQAHKVGQTAVVESGKHNESRPCPEEGGCGCENCGCENCGCENSGCENSGCENCGCENCGCENCGCENCGCENCGCKPAPRK